MNVNIVTVNSGWILQQIATRIASNAPDNHLVEVSNVANQSSDANYYIDIQNCYNRQKTKLDIGYFTHADGNSSEWARHLFDTTKAWSLDGIVSMNKRYTDMLVGIGYPTNRITTLTPGQTYDTFPLKKLRIGVVSRGGYPGYGQQFLERFFATYQFPNVRFKFLGRGWEALNNFRSNNEIQLYSDAEVPYDKYVDFYHSIDYLLIPGLWTAGPMSMQEALSCGLPIISADVGFTNYEFKADYVFEPNNISQLAEIINSIDKVRLDRRNQVSHMSWRKHAKDVIDFIEYIKTI